MGRGRQPLHMPRGRLVGVAGRGGDHVAAQQCHPLAAAPRFPERRAEERRNESTMKTETQQIPAERRDSGVPPQATGSHLVAPPFDGKIKRPAERFFWWSWHPLYPKWSKSCWGGVTQQQAIDVRKIKTGGDWLSGYHNKLIRENDDGTLTEVLDSPDHDIEHWKRCVALKANGRDEPRGI